MKIWLAEQQIHYVKGVSGLSHPNVLSSAGAEDTDMIIAATHSDEGI